MSKKQSFINEMQSLMNSVDYKWASDEAKTYWEALVSQPEVEKRIERHHHENRPRQLVEKNLGGNGSEIRS